MISRVTASGSGVCGVLAFVLFFHQLRNCASDCGSWRFSKIILPALTETLFFSCFDSFFLFFPILLRADVRWLEFRQFKLPYDFKVDLHSLCSQPIELSSLSSIGNFVIILPFHSLLATFQVSFFKSLFWMKQIQGSVRVKIKEYVHAWCEFLFVSLLVILNFFPQINQFYYFTSVHGLQDVEITALTFAIH